MNFDYYVLRFFESIRTPALTAIMSVVTLLGQEVLPIFFVCLIFWCLDKKTGYILGFSYFTAAIILQSVKIGLRIERPWVRWDIEPVESALHGATGYSFPSGHTQAAVALFGNLAFSAKKLWLKILMWATALLVAISRLYLCVHTPSDVIAAFVLAIIMMLISRRVVEAVYDKRESDKYVFAVIGIVSLGVLIYAYLSVKNMSLPYVLGADCFKAAGAGLGFAFGYYAERHYIDFDTRCRSMALQIVKLVIGVAVALAIKEIPKRIFPGNMIADTLRYLAAGVWVTVLYPLIIKKFFAPKE
ncbi:MAG: phosphatase PAP2 family protein [Clostridia bacterium]|nr:phosphatase PAP2 family protein [Clostridia bacterium]